MFNNDDDKKQIKKPGFNAQAFKHAISMIESSGGKFLDNKNSSAAGKYHFLYNSIKNDPSMKGISKQEFMNRPELQESIMDKALNGELENYPYGESYANKLQERYNSKYNVNELSALVHFLGPNNTREFLKDPSSFNVPGKTNSTGQEYINKFQGFFDQYNIDNQVAPEVQPAPVPQYGSPSPQRRREDYPTQPIDNTRVAMRKPMIDMSVPENPSQNIYDMDLNGTNAETEANINSFKQGGDLNSQNSAKDLVTIFEGGGSHKENPLGGIPQGTGSNGKPNLVEEGETKWNDYIFSNAYDMEGNYTGQDGSKSNVFKKGGSLSGSSCGGPGQPPCDENYYETIRNSRQGQVRKNEDGSESTHLMADNNKDKAFPTLFRNKDGSWDDFSNDHDAAFNRATTDNEIYSFDNQNELFKFAREGSWKNNSNKFANGGNLIDPTDPPASKGPVPNDPETAKNVLSFLDNEYLPTPQPQEKKKDLEVYDNLAFPMAKMDEFGLTKNKVKIKDQREGHMKYDAGLGVLQNPTQSVDFDSLITDDVHKYVDGKPTVEKTGAGTARAFLDRYNHPVTRQRMKDQAGFTDEDIDNIIIRGLKAEKHDGGNQAGSNADTWTKGGKDQIFFGKDHLDNKGTETHERVHSSKMDEPMGLVLQKVLGNANDQKRKGTTRDGKGYVPASVRTYLNKPGETYGNFVGLREDLGMKPGEQIDVPTLQRLIKEKKIDSNFINVFDDDKMVKALNTIAYQENNNNKEYRLS